MPIIRNLITSPAFAWVVSVQVSRVKENKVLLRIWTSDSARSWSAGWKIYSASRRMKRLKRLKRSPSPWSVRYRFRLRAFIFNFFSTIVFLWDASLGEGFLKSTSISGKPFSAASSEIRRCSAWLDFHIHNHLFKAQTARIHRQTVIRRNHSERNEAGGMA